MSTFDRTLEEIYAQALKDTEQVQDEMRQRTRTVTSFAYAAEILAEADARISEILRKASAEIDRRALAEKRKEWS